MRIMFEQPVQKALKETLVVMRHAFKNSLIEIITVAGLQIGGLFQVLLWQKLYSLFRDLAVCW